MVGLDLPRFVWQAGPDADRYESTSHPRINTLVFVGLVGRVDIQRNASARASL